jgi:imidazolonepropionase-like amidohydrolase
VFFQLCRFFLVVPISLLWGPFLLAAPPGTAPPNGLREKAPSTHAFIKAKVFLSPDRIVENATLVIREGVVVSVEADGLAPAGAKVHEMNGQSIYPGFIDAYSTTSIPKPNSSSKHSNELITPEAEVADSFRSDDKLHDKLRKQGVVARLVAPESGIIKGSSVLVSTIDADTAESILVRSVAQHVRLGVPSGRGRSDYPNSPMGGVAIARQSFLDADWFGRSQTSDKHSQLPLGPQPNDGLASLYQSLQSRRLFIFDATHELHFIRADNFAREFSLNAVIRGSGQEYQQLDFIRRANRTVIVPVNFPKPPIVENPEAALEASLEDLIHWELAPENASRLVAAGVPIALTSYGLTNTEDFLDKVRTAVERGLESREALRALTTTPAKLFGVENQMGTLEPGKRADFVVANGDLFQAKTKLLQTWIDGLPHYQTAAELPDIRGTWTVTLVDEQNANRKGALLIGGTTSKRIGELQFKDDEDKLQKVRVIDLRLRDRRILFQASEEKFGREGQAQFSLTLLADTSNLGTDTPWRAVGSIRWSTGVSTVVRMRRTSSEPAKLDETNSKAAVSSVAKKETTPKASSVPLSTVNYPLGAFGRVSAPEQPSTLLIQNATLWTCGDKGVVKHGSMLIENGQIVSISEGSIEVPDGAVVIDAKGKHVTPGIIDCHSHIATDGGVNESSQAITAEVRMSDFIDSNHIQIYRQLAGGVTCSNILHGSANPIGGQNQVIKLRWGDSPDGMKMREAPPGIKFALGENVKQSSSVEPTGRYPQSRMGVEQIIRDAFIAAKEYESDWALWKREHNIPLPRRDLELEALLEVLRGERLVHCHSYRQDEILALLRLCEEFGIQVATLQHILEGYKVADAMAKHGAMGSSFSDWWAYKIEVFDAIPFNGAIMHHAGVNVSFNSDDAELARHLNHEAAKAVKYGNVPPDEALCFVTLNPAKQLRIDSWVGSLEPGKHADFVIWSGEPLSMFSRCEQTWIDGRCYFDLQSDQKIRDENASLKSKLIQKILASKEPAKSKDDKSEADDEKNWLRYDEFCRARNQGESP